MPLSALQSNSIVFETGMRATALTVVGGALGYAASAACGVSASLLAPILAVQLATHSILGGALYAISKEQNWKTLTHSGMTVPINILSGTVGIVGCLALGILTTPVAYLSLGLTATFIIVNLQPFSIAFENGEFWSSQ